MKSEHKERTQYAIQKWQIEFFKKTDGAQTPSADGTVAILAWIAARAQRELPFPDDEELIARIMAQPEAYGPRISFTGFHNPSDYDNLPLSAYDTDEETT